MRHFAAMPYAEVPVFVAELRGVRTDASGALCIPAFALEFAVLTAARSGEVLGARWSEIDQEARTWTLSAENHRARTSRRSATPLWSFLKPCAQSVRAR